MLTSTIQLTFSNSLILKDFFCVCWLGIWDNLHAPNTRWLDYCALHTLAWKFVRCSSIELFPSSGSHKQSTHFMMNLIGEFFFNFFWGEGGNMAYFLVLHFFQVLNSKIQRIIHGHLPPQNGSFPCFSILRINPILNSKLVHEKFTPNIEWNALQTTLS